VPHWQCIVGPKISEAKCLRADQINFEKGTVIIKDKGGKVRVVEIADRVKLDRADRSVRFLLF
jgi:site-specific recombinase XerD